MAIKHWTYARKCTLIQRYIFAAGIRQCARWLDVPTSTVYRLRDHPEGVASQTFDQMWEHVCTAPIP